jgi:L-cystine uptake protein TcyP (sodium:dicarboxylate symporter family)
MRKWAIIGGVIAVVVLLLIIGLLYWGGEGPPTVRLRDISIIFISLFAVLCTVIFAAILGAILWLVFTLKDAVVPLLETLTATVKRLQGTTEYLAEQAVKPVISAGSTFAGIRAATRAVTGGKPRITQRKRLEPPE